MELKLELSEAVFRRLEEAASSSFDDGILGLTAELEEEYSRCYDLYSAQVYDLSDDDDDDVEQVEDWLHVIDNLLTELVLWEAAPTVERRLQKEASAKVLIRLLNNRP